MKSMKTDYHGKCELEAVFFSAAVYHRLVELQMTLVKDQSDMYTKTF